MIGTIFRSEDVPAAERFDHWREVLAQTRPSDVTSPHIADFSAVGRHIELGPVAVTSMSCSPARYRRSTRMVRRSDPERYHLTLLLKGDMVLDHAERTSRLGPHDWHLVDSSRPYDLRTVHCEEPHVINGVGVDFPKTLLPLPEHQVQALLGRGLPGGDGVGALLAEFLIGLERQADILQPSNTPRLGGIVRDLLLAWLAQLLETEDILSSEDRRGVTAERVLAFMRQNLHDPEMTPPVIAAAHHISLSYLHQIFQDRVRDETVAAWIRRRRLEGARRDLADPSLRDTPIHTIAAVWGLPGASQFTRSFRATYGQSPREFRLQALSEQREEGLHQDATRFAKTSSSVVG